MASTDTAIRTAAGTSLQEAAKRHLWMHFTRMGAYADAEVPIIVRGEGAYVYDEHGNRYLDGLSALFCVNAGHGRTELGEAAARQVEELDFFVLWSYAHPRAIELAERIAKLAPGDLNRVFFTSGGSEAVESAIKLVRAYHQRTGNPRKIKFLSREIAYHGTTLGALQATGITALRTDFEPLVPGGIKAPNTNSYHWPEGRDPLWAADQIEEKILFEGPETVAAVILEPLQNAGGCIPPQDGYFQRVREICDRHDVLLVSDEVICAWGRLGHYFGCERYGYQPDIVTTAKALTSAYAPMGAMIASEKVYEPFATARSRSPTGSPSAGTRWRPRWRWPTSTSTSARTSAATCCESRTSSAPCSTACATSRSSATSAATASSTRSSWSWTRRRRRDSPTRSRSGCCAASSPASSTAAG